MHRVLFAGIMIACTLLGCRQASHHRLPSSSARTGEVLVVGDTTGQLASYLSRPEPGLPQPEPRFDVRPTTQDQLKGNALLARAIVILNDKPYASGHDLNARPQLVIEASAKDSARILRDLQVFEEQAAYAFLQHNHHPKMEEKIRRQFGVQMKVPEAMRASKTSKDFLWIATNGAENLRSLCVLRLADSPKADWARAIDQMLSQHIHGDQASSSMHLALATVQTHQERGIHLLTGQWMMEGDAMGGPFVASVKKTRQSALVLLAFAYAPEREKRNIMRQLRTVVFNDHIFYGE